MRVSIDIDGLQTSATVSVEETTIGTDGDRAASQARRLLVNASIRAYAGLFPDQPRWDLKA